MFEGLMCWLRFHNWRDTLWNRYAEAMEQRCKCGQARHIIGWEDFKGEYPGVKQWREGPHPSSVCIVGDAT